MLYISICHWAYHSYNIMTWASFQRHKTSQTVQTEPRQGFRSKGFFFTGQFRFWLSAQETFTVVLVIFYRRGYTWKGRFAHGKISNRGALKEKIKASADTVNPHLCKCERFLIVEEEVVLLLLIVFPYWAAIQQLGHLVFMQWDLLVNKKLLKTYLVPVY